MTGAPRIEQVGGDFHHAAVSCGPGGQLDFWIAGRSNQFDRIDQIVRGPRQVHRDDVGTFLREASTLRTTMPRAARVPIAILPDIRPLPFAPRRATLGRYPAGCTKAVH